MGNSVDNRLSITLLTVYIKRKKGAFQKKTKLTFLQRTKKKNTKSKTKTTKTTAAPGRKSKKKKRERYK